MNDFLSKMMGQSETGMIIALDNAHAHKIETACKEQGFKVLDSTDEIVNELRIANKIIVPLYRVIDDANVYSIAMGYASGQISVLKKDVNIFVNPKYSASAFVLLATHDFLNKSERNWLGVTGLSYQPE